MQQSTEKETSVAFQRLFVTPETQTHGNELKELTTFKTNIFTATEMLHKEKKKCPNSKSIFEFIKKNETTDISEKQAEEYLNQMINLNLIFNNKTNQ